MSFRSESPPQPDNVYLLKKAATSYKKAAHITSNVFDAITENLIDLKPGLKLKSHKALDIGIGTGNFTIPIIKNFIDRI